jgi:hypothetical protein
MAQFGRSSALVQLAFVTLVAAGCSGTKADATPDAGADVWSDGQTFTTSLEIAEGSTMTIAPGAKLVAGKGVTLTVRGTLKIASAAGTHARIGAAVAGQTWGGIVVEDGGDLEADGLDLDGAAAALDVRAGAAAAHYAHGTISTTSIAFTVERAGRLDLLHATVLAAAQPSTVNGQLHASYLDYEKTGLASGIVMGDATAVFDVSDSKFHGAGVGGSDYIISYGADLVHVAYSTVTDSHCAFHFDFLNRFELDHVTAGATSPTGDVNQNVWGAMLYGSGAGPNVISNSNFMNGEMNLDQQGMNGPLTITNTYSTGRNAQDDPSGWTWLPADVVTAPIVDAQPR